MKIDTQFPSSKLTNYTVSFSTYRKSYMNPALWINVFC